MAKALVARRPTRLLILENCILAGKRVDIGESLVLFWKLEVLVGC